MPWDPNQYLAFADHRLRPALDLLARIPHAGPRRVYDLGCGTGNVTRILQQRWPHAVIVGVDSSPEMLASARSGCETIAWEQGDLAQWMPEEPPDVIFSNAALHWLGQHQSLFPRLFGQLAPGGVLAVQMPNNFAAPSHRCIMESVMAGPWTPLLAPLLSDSPVAEPRVYHDMLSPLGAEVDVWQTEYLQRLEGENPVVRWTSSTALRPFLDALDEPLHGRFLADYAARIAQAYPPSPDGSTLFPFRRLFLLARKPG